MGNVVTKRGLDYVLHIGNLEYLFSEKDMDLIVQDVKQIFSRNNFYYLSYPRKKYEDQEIMIHRIIAGRIQEKPKRLAYADHINGNTLDNRRENLRWATPAQNRQNSKTDVRNKLGVKGVHIFSGKYRAMICNNGKRMHLGLFDTIEEAKDAYDRKAKELFGDFVRN